MARYVYDDAGHLILLPDELDNYPYIRDGLLHKDFEGFQSINPSSDEWKDVTDPQYWQDGYRSFTWINGSWLIPGTSGYGYLYFKNEWQNDIFISAIRFRFNSSVTARSVIAVTNLSDQNICASYCYDNVIIPFNYNWAAPSPPFYAISFSPYNWNALMQILSIEVLCTQFPRSIKIQRIKEYCPGPRLYSLIGWKVCENKDLIIYGGLTWDTAAFFRVTGTDYSQISCPTASGYLANFQEYFSFFQVTGDVFKFYYYNGESWILEYNYTHPAPPYYYYHYINHEASNGDLYFLTYILYSATYPNVYVHKREAATGNWTTTVLTFSGSLSFCISVIGSDDKLHIITVSAGVSYYCEFGESPVSLSFTVSDNFICANTDPIIFENLYRTIYIREKSTDWTRQFLTYWPSSEFAPSTLYNPLNGYLHLYMQMTEDYRLDHNGYYEQIFDTATWTLINIGYLDLGHYPYNFKYPQPRILYSYSYNIPYFLEYYRRNYDGNYANFDFTLYSRE